MRLNYIDELRVNRILGDHPDAMTLFKTACAEVDRVRTLNKKMADAIHFALEDGDEMEAERRLRAVLEKVEGND